MNTFEEYERELEQRAKQNEEKDRRAIRRNVLAKGRLEHLRLRRAGMIETRDEEE